MLIKEVKPQFCLSTVVLCFTSVAQYCVSAGNLVEENTFVLVNKFCFYKKQPMRLFLNLVLTVAQNLDLLGFNYLPLLLLCLLW